MGKELGPPLDLDNNTCVTELAIKALVAPDGLTFSGDLVYELASRLIEARLELQRVSVCEVADQLAKESLADCQLEILCAAEWAKKHLAAQKGSSRA